MAGESVCVLVAIKYIFHSVVRKGGQLGDRPHLKALYVGPVPNHFRMDDFIKYAIRQARGTLTDAIRVA